MKCHYEVLNIPRIAEDAEIKTAYRKLALKWHPDKNLDNSDYAKEQFLLVQQAYEVLSDKHERAWYDKHREQILHSSNSEFKDNSLDVFQYFGSCFKGYGDDENGFFTIYRNVFEKIAKEDLVFIENKEEFCEIPSFGDSKTEYENVAEFYAYWSNYVTKKSYVWLDIHNIKDIRDRRYIKYAEKENKKVRQCAKKERNEEIRNLVAFVRKRDKRVQIQKKVLEQKQLEDKKKREQLKIKKKLERQQELNNNLVQPEWAKFENFKSELEELEKKLTEEFGDDVSHSEDETEELLNKLYCVACNKLFKTTKAFENHEFSKKHKDNVELLKVTLLDEENSQEDGDSDKEGDDNLKVTNFGLDFEKNDKLKNKKEQNIDLFEENESDNVLYECDIIKQLINSNSLGETTQLPKKKKKTKNVITSNDFDNCGNDNYLNVFESSDNEDFTFNDKHTKRKNKKKKEKVNISNPEQKDQQLNGLETIKVQNIRSKKKKDNINHLNIDISHSCLTCKSIFSSKNKLFDHLKKTGHGVYIDKSVKVQTK